MNEHMDPTAAISDPLELSAGALADLCDALVAAWRHDATASAEGSAANSQSARDAAAAAVLISERAPRNVEHAPLQMAGRMVDAIGLLVQSIGTLLRAEPLIAIAMWPVVRAEIEYAGRVTWLLEPLADEDAGIRRVARALLEQLAGLQRQRFTTDKWNHAQANKFKQARDKLLAQVRQTFDDVHTPMAGPEEIAQWRVGGETMMPLGKAAGLFFSLNVTNGKALYDILSDYSHPSVISLAMQSQATTEDGATFWSYPASPTTIDFQVRLGCIALYKSALALLDYSGFPYAALESWATGAPEHWFGADS